MSPSNVTDGLPVAYHLQRSCTRPQLTRCEGTWGELAALLAHGHQERDDKDGPGIVLAEMSKPYRNAANVARFDAVLMDMDSHGDTQPPPPDDAAEMLAASGLAGVVYTTHSHTDDAPRYRVVVPLSAPILPADLAHVTRAAASAIGLDCPALDPKSWVVGQFFYLPSCRPDAPRFLASLDGAAFVPPAAEVLALPVAAAAPPALAAPAAAPYAAPRHAQPGGSVIDAFDAAHRITDTLARYGYKQMGERWLSPRSTSGTPGVTVFERDNCCFIHHSSDPLYGGDGGQPRAPFDFFREFEHGGDIRAATRAAAELLGMRRERAASAAVAPAARADVDVPEWVDSETGEIYGGDEVAGAAQPPAKQRSAPAPAIMGEFPDMTPRGKPKATIANTQAALARLGVTVRYNLIRKDIEILIPGEAFTVDNRDNAALAWLMSEFTKLDIPTEKLGDYLLYIADRNQYNPVAVWVQSRPWDGVSRLQSLLDTITADGEDKSRDVKALKEAMMRRWLLSCIAAAFEPDDAQLGGVLVLQGPQAIGKTAWFKSLVPASLKLIQDGLSLRVEDKDSVKQVISYWMVELGELDGTFRKTDIAQLKAFITRDKDTIRRAYARTESTYRRRTVFFASVNNEHFLQDDTGNRRYWTVAAEKINYSHGLDMQQVWAEVYADHYLKGQKWWLSPAEAALLHASNTKHEALDPVRERLSTQFCWGADGGQWRWITTTDALIEAGIVRPTRSDLAIGGPALRELNGGKVKAGRARTTYYLVPPAVSRL